MKLDANYLKSLPALLQAHDRDVCQPKKLVNEEILLGFAAIVLDLIGGLVYLGHLGRRKCSSRG